MTLHEGLRKAALENDCFEFSTNLPDFEISGDWLESIQMFCPIVYAENGMFFVIRK
jgi:hypothetical protein